jgi:hypothetical protein
VGVEGFFVISGYLITSLLLKEWGRDQRVNLKVFWLRRARRLLPALFLLFAGVLTFAVVFLPEEVAGLRPAALAAGLLISVALAFIWAPGRRTKVPSALLDAAGLLASAGLFFAFHRLNEFKPFLYRGGFGAVSLASALVIATSVDGRSRLLPRLLGWGPLRWAGLRSYGIYLWHWPVFQVTHPQLDLPLDGLPLFALRMARMLGLVELSYRFVEIPVRTGALGRAWHNWRSASSVRRWRLAGNWTVVGALVLAYCGLLINNVAAAKPPPPPAYLSVKGVDTLALSGASAAESQVAVPGRSQMGIAEDPPATGASRPPGQAPTTVDSATSTMPAGSAPAGHQRHVQRPAVRRDDAGVAGRATGGVREREGAACVGSAEQHRANRRGQTLRERRAGRLEFSQQRASGVVLGGRDSFAA